MKNYRITILLNACFLAFNLFSSDNPQVTLENASKKTDNPMALEFIVEKGCPDCSADEVKIEEIYKDFKDNELYQLANDLAEGLKKLIKTKEQIYWWHTRSLSDKSTPSFQSDFVEKELSASNHLDFALTTAIIPALEAREKNGQLRYKRALLEKPLAGFKTDEDEKLYEQRMTRLNTVILTEGAVRGQVQEILQHQVHSLTPALLADRRKKLDYCKKVQQKGLLPGSKELKKVQGLAEQVVDHTERITSAFEQKNKEAIALLNTYLIDSLKVLEILE